MRNTEKVGQNAGQFIDFIIRETGLNLQDIHFIGNYSQNICTIVPFSN